MTDTQDIQFASTHEWFRLEGNVATVGLSAFAVDQLGDLVFVSLPEVDATVTAKDSCAEVESVKAVGDVYSPVSGKVTDVNTDLVENIEWLSDDPYGKGWMFRVEVEGTLPTDFMDAAAYEKHVAEEDI